MPNYRIRSYRRGDEVEHVEIDRRVASTWLWPFGYSLDELRDAIEHPDFDPNLQLYCFADGDMVAHTSARVGEPDEDGRRRAWLSYPRALPGHEPAVELLLQNALERLRERKVDIAETRASTMWPESFALMQALGYRETADRPRGYKKYVVYDLGQGRLPQTPALVEDLNPERDFDESSTLASVWYHCSPDAARRRLESFAEDEGTVAQLVLRRRGEIVAACAVAANSLQRESLAAIFYIYARDAQALRALVSTAVERSMEAGFETLLVDLIYEHRYFEPTYLDLGFRQAAEWSLYEKPLR